MRDNGAIWVEQTDAQGKKSMAVQGWGFDGWGGDGGPSRKDDAVPPRVAAINNVAVEKVNVVIEKRTLEFNGNDTVITSWTVLSQRNPTMSKLQIETVLKDKFGVSRVIWLEGASGSLVTVKHDGEQRHVTQWNIDQRCKREFVHLIYFTLANAFWKNSSISNCGLRPLESAVCT